LNAAYKSKNLKRVREIIEQLKNGHFKHANDNQSTVTQLRLKVEFLKSKLAQRQKFYSELTNSQTYRIILANEDLEVYFEQLEKELSKENEFWRKQVA
jgi:hypothetical protein